MHCVTILSHCCHICPWLCAWGGCIIICCRFHTLMSQIVEHTEIDEHLEKNTENLIVEHLFYTISIATNNRTPGIFFHCVNSQTRLTIRDTRVYIREKLGYVSFITVQSYDVCKAANDRVHYGAMFVYICLRITQPHHYADVSEGIGFLKYLLHVGTLCRVCLRLSRAWP